MSGCSRVAKFSSLNCSSASRSMSVAFFLSDLETYQWRSWESDVLHLDLTSAIGGSVTSCPPGFHSVGDAGSPIRMPISPLNGGESSPPILTAYDICWYSILIHWQSNSCPPAPRRRSFTHSVDCSVDGKAFVISTDGVFPK